MVQRLDGGLDGCSSCGKCSTEGEWGELIVTKNGIQAVHWRKKRLYISQLKKKIIQD